MRLPGGLRSAAAAGTRPALYRGVTLKDPRSRERRALVLAGVGLGAFGLETQGPFGAQPSRRGGARGIRSGQKPEVSMYQIRRSEDRGQAEHGWLSSRHTFSFAEYYDPKHMGFGPLRVINEDRVVGGAGFPTHPHRDMEIISYVLEGGLEHKDSMGTGSVIRPGEVQRMTAGTGVLHSEYNASKTDPVHFLQIWILPERRGIEPSYEQKAFAPEEKRNRFRILASRDGREGSVSVHQDANLFGATLAAGAKLEQDLDPARKAWLQVARGEVVLDGETLRAGDAVAFAEASKLSLEGQKDAELLLFDLA